MSVVWDEEERLLCPLTGSLLKHRQVCAAMFVFRGCLFSPRRAPSLFVIFLPAIIYLRKDCKIGNFYMSLLWMIIWYLLWCRAHINLRRLLSVILPPTALSASSTRTHHKFAPSTVNVYSLWESCPRQTIKNKIYYSPKAARKVITKFQRRAHCLPIRTQLKCTLMEQAAKVIHFRTQVNPLFPRMGNGRPLKSAATPDSAEQEEELLH